MGEQSRRVKYSWPFPSAPTPAPSPPSAINEAGDFPQCVREVEHHRGRAPGSCSRPPYNGAIATALRLDPRSKAVGINASGMAMTS